MFCVSRSVESVIECLEESNCVIPNDLQGLLPAFKFFCDEEEYGRQYHSVTDQLSFKLDFHSYGTRNRDTAQIKPT